MTTTAQISQGATVKIGTGSSGAKTITAITKANPGVISSAAHGLVPGDIVTLAGIVGMVELNGKTGVVSDVSAGAFTLQGAGVRDTTLFTTYASGGTATPVAFANIANIKSFAVNGGASADIDVSNLQSTAKEYLQGLRDGGDMTLDIDFDQTDAGQLALLAAQLAGAVKSFRITPPTGPSATFNGNVKKVSFSGGVDQALKRPVDVKITGDVTWA